MPLAKNLIEAAGNATQANYIEDVFSTYLYTGTGAAQTITNNIDLSTKGGLVWTKRREAIDSHRIFDTQRGENSLSSDSTAAQTSTSGVGITSFNTNGFSLGVWAEVNASGANYASWTFRKQPKFFDVVTFTTDGSGGATVSHNLGSTPGCVVVKGTGASDWLVYHRSLSSTSKYLVLNSTGAAGDYGSAWITTSSTQITFPSGGLLAGGATYVMYLYGHDAGGFGLTGTDNVISCGSYTGSATDWAAGATLGFEPQWVLIKNITSGTTNWNIFDNMRGMFVSTADDPVLFPNLSNAEEAYNLIQPTATGFQVANSSRVGGAGNTCIYIAIRRGPMKVPTDATKVFAPVAFTGTNTTTVINAGFPIDMAWIKARNTNATIGGDGYDFDRLRGQNGRLLLNATSAEDTTWGAPYDSLDNMTGLGAAGSFFNNSAVNYADWFFRRAPSFFDEVCYTGTGTAGQTFSHNLGVTPELIIVKKRSATANWAVYSSSVGATYYLPLNLDSAKVLSDGAWNNTSPSSSVFTVGNGSQTNTSGSTYVAYLFATCTGVSKVGSYTGTGTTKQVDCGFAAGARFVLIKRADSTGDWYVWDSARGIVSGNDPYLLLNSTAAEVTSTDYIDTYSAGFELSSTAPAALNASGGTFIFFAVA